MIDFSVIQKGKEFRILQLTDMQVIDSTQKRFSERLNAEETEKWQPQNMKEMLFNSMDKLVAETNPDLIIITGDITYGEFDDTGKSLLAFIEKMESYNVPWAPVWGNHDNESVLGVDWQCQQFINAKNCLFKKGITVGCSNYTIGIKSSDGALCRVMYMMDSNGCYNASKLSLLQGVRTEVGLVSQQLDWMRASYANICKEYGNSVPSFVCFHIETIDYLQILEQKGYYNPQAFCKYDIIQNGEDFGDIHETICAGEYLISALSTFKAVNVDGAFFGHSHVNNASIVSEGIRWTYGLKTGLYDYHEKEKLGGTLITLSNKCSQFSVEHIRSFK